MKVKSLPNVIVMDVRLDCIYYLVAQVEVNHGGSGSYGQQVD